MKYGFEAVYGGFRYLIKVVIQPTSTLRCEGVDLLPSGNSGLILGAYISDIASILMKEKPI